MFVNIKNMFSTDRQMGKQTGTCIRDLYLTTTKLFLKAQQGGFWKGLSDKRKNDGVTVPCSNDVDRAGRLGSTVLEKPHVSPTVKASEVTRVFSQNLYR